MKTFASVLSVLVSLTLVGPRIAAARDFGVFKVTATIPVVRVDADDKLVTKTLTTNDVINLSLGKALGTPVKATDNTVLALVTTYEDTGTPISKLVIYDPSKTGSVGIILTVAQMSSLSFVNTGGGGSKNAGVGIARGTFNATPAMNDSANFAILSGDFAGQATGGGRHLISFHGGVLLNVPPKPAGAATFSGKFKFQFKDRDNNLVVWDGIVVKGAFKLVATPIATYSE